MQTLKTDTRKRILNVSKMLFLKKGFRETTTRDIAREAGINLSNLYHFFSSMPEEGYVEATSEEYMGAIKKYIFDGRTRCGRFLFWNKMKHRSLLEKIYG